MYLREREEKLNEEIRNEAPIDGIPEEIPLRIGYKNVLAPQ